MSNKPGFFGIRLRYYAAAIGLAGAAIALNNDEPEPVQPKGECIVHLDDKIGVKSASIVEPGTNRELITFTQGTDVLAGKYTGEGIETLRDAEGGKPVRSSVGDFHVAVEAGGTRAVACETNNATYPVKYSVHEGQAGKTIFTPKQP